MSSNPRLWQKIRTLSKTPPPRVYFRFCLGLLWRHAGSFVTPTLAESGRTTDRRSVYKKYMFWAFWVLSTTEHRSCCEEVNWHLPTVTSNKTFLVQPTNTIYSVTLWALTDCTDETSSGFGPSNQMRKILQNNPKQGKIRSLRKNHKGGSSFLKQTDVQ